MINSISKSQVSRNLIFLLTCLLLNPFGSFSQGYNHHWLLGYWNGPLDTNMTSTKARLLFDSLNTTLIPETRKLPFLGTQANISDANGNLLMSTNGCWIADATGDTMLNGSGLNPGYYAGIWCNNQMGMPIPHGDVIIPFPDDSTKYCLFHQTFSTTLTNRSGELYYTEIDMSLNGGLGGVVVNKKNIPIIQDTLSMGFAACKHANGRDWWIVVFKDSTDIVFKVLVDPTGIASISTQSLGLPIMYIGEGQPSFSPDGKRFAYSDNYGSGNNVHHNVRLLDFDRCTGIFSNPQFIDLFDKKGGLGVTFSSNSKFLYACSFKRIFQISIDSLTVDTVAVNDGYASPSPPFYTDFWTMYLAANGRIYISTGNSTLDLHYIQYPDSSGTSCNVNQHALHLPCYSGRDNVYHPNYYLGCDTTLNCGCISGVNENAQHDFRFRIYPNPVTNNNLHIGYLLPQNKAGVFIIYDVTGKIVFKYNLPQWSNEQSFDLPDLSNGVYNCVITSNNYRVSKKLVVIKE